MVDCEVQKLLVQARNHMNFVSNLENVVSVINNALRLRCALIITTFFLFILNYALK